MASEQSIRDLILLTIVKCEYDDPQHGSRLAVSSTEIAKTIGDAIFDALTAKKILKIGE